MNTIRLITVREFTERLRSRTFLVSNGAVLLLIVLSMALPILLGNDGPTRLGAVGRDAGRVAEIAVAQQAAFGVDLEVSTVEDVAAAEEAIDEGELDAVLLDQRTVLVERSLGRALEALLSSAANAVQVDDRLAGAGLGESERRELFAIESLEVRSRTTDGGPVDPFPPAVMVASIGVFVLYGLLIVYGQWVAQGIVEEKQSRVIEVLLATVRPVELLAGKIVGLGLLGFAQILLITAVALAGLRLTDVVDLPDSGYGALALVVAWYVPGYLLYGTIFAMAGAVVSRVEDMQSAVTPVIIVLVLALFAAQAALADPTSTVATAAGLFPLTAPIVQPVLAASGVSSGWEMIGAALLAVGAIALMLPVCGRIYRGGILAMRGRITFRDAWSSSRT